MFLSTKLSVNRTSREILRELMRHISKTSSVSNSDAFSRHQDNRLKVNHELGPNRSSMKCVKVNTHNHIRALSTIPSVTSASLVSEPTEETREFMAMFPDIVRDLTGAGRHTNIPEVTKRFTKALEYNVPTGMNTRGVSIVTTYKSLVRPENLTPENIKLANILGWCTELLHAHFIVTDDITDNSETRRGYPCWYRLDDVGLQAVNDGILFENSCYDILKIYFSNQACYVPIIELFHDITLKTALGQLFDGSCKENGKPKLDIFTMDRYSNMAKHKIGYTYQLPVSLAMYLANIYNEEQHRQAKTIMLEIGKFYQIQNDYFDCYAHPTATGRIGTDIAEGKFTWLAVVALQKANPAQRKIMEDHYGRPEEQSIEAVKKLYEELSLRAAYAAYEEESFNMIKRQIQQISKGVPHEVFFRFMRKIYKRDC